MKKMRSAQVTWSLPLDPRHPDETLQSWLYRTLRQAILIGRLPCSYVLPSTRYLAAQHGLARGTVQAAYSQLLSEGYLVTARGSGTKVSASLPDDQFVKAALTPPTQADCSQADKHAPMPLTQWGLHLLDQEPAFPILPKYSKQPFVPHTCDVTHFPVDTWRRLHMRQLASVHPVVLSNRSPQGLPALRQAIVEHLGIARGVTASSENIVIVSSVQQALDICLRLIVAPGESVWMEDPGYPGARQVMQAVGAEIVSVAVDSSGIRVADAVRLHKNAKLAYVTPCRQAPMGTALSPDRRAELLRWASDNSAYIFEDDYDSEYRFINKPIPALRSTPHAEKHVILSGTFSKLLFPALGLAYVVLPPQLVEPFKRALSLTSRSANGLAQAVLADFMFEGHFGRHIRRMRKIYGARAKTFELAAKEYLDGFIEIPPIVAGLDVVGRLVSHTETQAIDFFNSAKVEVFPLSRYTQNAIYPPSLVMGFASYTEEQIHTQMRAISRIIHA